MGRRANTISDKDWKSIQDRAVKANPTRGEAAMKRGRDNYRNRGNC